MMQVAGGMDRLPAALAARLGNRIVYRAAVREIRQSERGVWVVYADADGRPRRVDADYCVCTIPLPVLSDLQKDLSPPVQPAIAAASYDGAGKIGLQFKRRFWEQDDEIYGGRSWTDQEIGQIIYPSHGFNGSKGVLVGYYLDFNRTMRERPPAERQRLALEQGGRIHPQYTTEFETAFSVSWTHVPWSRGSWRSESPAAHEALPALRQPDGRVHFAGDYMTDMSSWMQGAFESAREVAAADPQPCAHPRLMCEGRGRQNGLNARRAEPRMREQLHQRIAVRRRDQHDRDNRPQPEAIPDAQAVGRTQRHGELECGRLNPPARSPGRERRPGQAQRAQEQDHAAHAPRPASAQCQGGPLSPRAPRCRRGAAGRACRRCDSWC